VLPGFLAGLAGSLPWPKTMRWREDGYLFPRPIRWVVALLDDAVMPVTVAGVSAGNRTRGHRLLGPGEHAVPDASSLEAVLLDTGVLLDPGARRTKIVAELNAEAESLGGRVVEDPSLLDEVVFLAESPTVYSGSFDRGFLEVPREVTVTAMRSHQRYFAVEDARGRLLPHFLVVCDGEWTDPSQVILGNERVLRARLADARFYWDFDLKTGLDGLAASLSKVVWLEAVGTLAEKAERVVVLVDRLGRRWHGDAWTDLRDPALRAARLAKADLASEMIKDGKEFTGLQGAIGARYAEASGEDKRVVAALAEQYLPRGAKDPLPRSEVGTVLATADRIDTIAGCWAAGFVPSGSQDPYALRRAGNGIMRMLLEGKRHLSLAELVGNAVRGLPPPVQREGLDGDVLDFLRERLAYFLRERGIAYDVVDAVLAADFDDPVDAMVRAEALQDIRGEESLERLVIGYKRAANIIKGVAEAELPDVDAVPWGEAEEAERALHEAAGKARKAVRAAAGKRDYEAVLGHLLALRRPIDTFFDAVMVMAEDPAERGRRLALLVEVRGLFADICDLSRIVIEGEK
jgi:glycyl-tRNA synthetase beta chain